jgi:hypothetical protein
MFLRPNEVARIQHDYESVVKGQDGCKITIEYRTWQDPTAPPEIDDVYKVDRRLVAEENVTACVRAIQQIVKASDVKLLATTIVQVGDCILYFSTKQNLAEPEEGKPVVPDSMVFIDPSGIRWVPSLPHPSVVATGLVFRAGGIQIGQPVPCKIQK